MSDQKLTGRTTSRQDEFDGRIKRGPLFVALTTIVICFIIFLAADDAALRFPQAPPGLWEAVKALSLALIPAVVVAGYDHYRTIGETSSRVAQIIGKDLRGYVGEEINALLQGRETYGLVRFHSGMDFSGLFNGLGQGDELLWHDTYAPAEQLFINDLRRAVERGARIRMLAIDGQCDNAVHRANEITDPAIQREFLAGARQFSERIRDLLSHVTDIASSGGSIEIRLYHDLPSLPMYIVLRNRRPIRGFSSFFLTKPTGLGFVHIEWAPTSRGTGVLEELVAYFNQKWEAQARPGGGGAIFVLPASGAQTSIAAGERAHP